MKRKPILHCVIVESERDPGYLSIRAVAGGKGGTFKRELTAAGFEKGDLVTIALRRGRIYRPRPTEVKP